MSSLADSREVAEYLGINPQTLANWSSQGKGPKFTKVGNRRRYRWEDVYAFAGHNPHAEGPVLNCAACRKPVHSDGFIGIRLGRVFEVEKAHQEWRARVDRAAPMDIRDAFEGLPDPEPWGILHHGCNPDPEASWYSYEVERVDTWPKFAWFQAHVLEKEWSMHTDLPTLLRRVAPGGDA